MYPNKRQQVTVIYCCSIAFIETNASTKYYTSTTKYISYPEFDLKAKSPNVIAMPMDTIGSMLSVPVRVPECPDSLLALLFMCQKLGLKLARNEWRCCPVLVNNPWRHSPSFTQANHWG